LATSFNQCDQQFENTTQGRSYIQRIVRGLFLLLSPLSSPDSPLIVLRLWVLRRWGLPTVLVFVACLGQRILERREVVSHECQRTSVRQDMSTEVEK
jgi:hypothetical protein